MARLRISDGYTRVHNELIERVFCKYTFPAYETRLIWAIIRMSWGWNQRGCYTSLNELAEKTGIDKRNCSRAVKALVSKFVLDIRNGAKKTYVELNTDYMTWKLPDKETLFTGVCRDTGRDTQAVSVETPVTGVCRDTGTSLQSLAAVCVPACLKKEEKKQIKETVRPVKENIPLGDFKALYALLDKISEGKTLCETTNARRAAAPCYSPSNSFTRSNKKL